MELVNVAPTAVKERKPRLENTHIPSELGIFGPEFACVVTGIDSNGYVVAVLSGLGKSSSQILEDYFSDYLGDITFLCSDDYDAYTRDCDNNAIPHYIQPSDMKNIVRKEQKDWAEKHNWSISHNKQHPTSRHDAENILIDLLQSRGTTYRSEDITAFWKSKEKK